MYEANEVVRGTTDCEENAMVRDAADPGPQEADALNASRQDASGRDTGDHDSSVWDASGRDSGTGDPNTQDPNARDASAPDSEAQNPSAQNADACDSAAQDLSTGELGKRGERVSAAYLERAGYTILERNWFCPAGEVDIIARGEDDELVFVEVKTRRSISAGFPEEAVTLAKRRRYEQIALHYLSQADAGEGAVRFDVVSLVVISANRALLRHHLNAFAVGE